MAITVRENRIKPFLRWAGGKAWFVPKMAELLQANAFTSYHEPFLGGGAIFFSLGFEECEVSLSDANKELIDTYISLRDELDAVWGELQTYTNSKEFYYELREKTPSTSYEKAAQFIFLNRTSFNGLYRVNREGKYNVPYGNLKHPSIRFEVLAEASQALQGVELSVRDFSNAFDNIGQGSLVFLDPPYTVSHNNNGFIAYNQNLFSLEDQNRLAKEVEKIQARGGTYVLTNAAHEKVKEIFANCGEPIVVNRQSLIGGKQAKRGLTQEYIFTNIETAR